MGARYADGRISRFLSRDPVPVHDHVYARDNPVSLVDPSGLYPAEFEGRATFSKYFVEGTAEVVPEAAPGSFPEGEPAPGKASLSEIADEAASRADSTEKGSTGQSPEARPAANAEFPEAARGVSDGGRGVQEFYRYVTRHQLKELEGNPNLKPGPRQRLFFTTERYASRYEAVDKLSLYERKDFGVRFRFVDDTEMFGGTPTSAILDETGLQVTRGGGSEFYIRQPARIEILETFPLSTVGEL